MWEFLYGNITLRFTDEVVKLFDSYRQTRKDMGESGGILLGRLFEGSVSVEHISTPGEGDSSGRYHFYRSVKRAQDIVNKAWQDSNGQVIYLGEWHSHPESNPRPSKIDVNLITNMLKDSLMEIDFLLLVILGDRNVDYVGCAKNGKLVQLQKKPVT